MKTKLLLLVVCIFILKTANTQIICTGKFVRFEPDTSNQLLFTAKVYNLNGKPSEFWDMFSNVEEVNIQNYNYLFQTGKIFPHGKHYSFYPNSRIMYEENLSFGKRVGEFKRYYPSGLELFKGSLDNRSNGDVTHYFPDGSTRKSVSLKNEVPDGVVTEFFQDGNIHSVTNYRDGKKNGQYASYYPDGKIEREVRFRKDEIVSDKCYDPSGHEVECDPFYAETGFRGGDEAFIRELEKISFLPDSSTSKSFATIELSVDTLGKAALRNLFTNEKRLYFQDIDLWTKQLSGFVPAEENNRMLESQVKITMSFSDGKFVHQGEVNKTSEFVWDFELQDEICRLVYNFDLGDHFENLGMPEFPGGEKALLRYLGQNIRYPAYAREKGIRGIVIVDFKIDETGKVKDAAVRYKIYPSLDEEALRVINSMPNWKPATKEGKPVTVHYTLPIRFELSE